VHELRRFLGLSSYFRRFIPNYARISEPLSCLLKKHAVFKWSERQQTSFDALKQLLVTEPVLQLYRSDARTEVHTDASIDGLGGVLLQEGVDGELHPVYYCSKRTTEAERCYHSTRLELLAIVYVIERMRNFLLSIPFVLVTDCNALVYLNATKTLKPQVARWFDLLQEYDFTIKHRPGVNMGHVDALSRAPDSSKEVEAIDEVVSK